MPEPMTILAAASTVVNIIAAHNTTNGGQGAVALATLQYLRNTADRVEQVQDQLSSLLREVSQLEQKQREALRAENQFQDRLEVGKAAYQYMLLLKESTAGYEDYETWRTNPNVARTLGELDTDLDRALGTFVAQNMYDALTALQLPMLAHVHLAVRAALDYKSESLLQRAKAFLEYFALVCDGQQVGSTVEQLQAAQQRHAQLLSTPELAPVETLLKVSPKGTASVCAPAVFVEVLPEHEEMRFELVFENDRARRLPMPHIVPTEYFGWRVLNFESAVEEVDAFEGAKVWQLGPLQSRAGAKGEFANGFPFDLRPPNDPDSFQPVVIAVPKGLLFDVAHEESQRSRAAVRLEKIIAKAASLNANRMTMVLCANALTAAEVTRAKLIETFGIELVV